MRSRRRTVGPVSIGTAVAQPRLNVTKSPLRIIVTGLIAQHPSLGGMTWHYFQYVLGLVRLGHDVYYTSKTQVNGLTISTVVPPKRIGSRAIHQRMSIISPASWRVTVLAKNGAIGLRDLQDRIPQGSTVILIDEDLRCLRLERSIPLTEQNRQYWGPPADDFHAIAELKRGLASGATFLAIAPNCFWWLEHYPALARELKAGWQVVVESPDIKIFRIK